LAIAWIVLGVVLIVLELHHAAFYALFVALGAFAAAIVAVFAPGALVAQVATVGIVTGVGIPVLRPRISAAFAHHYDGVAVKGVHGGLVGQEVLTLDEVGDIDRIGHVRLAGERWRAVSGGDHPIPEGTRVLVTAVEGTTLTVWPVDGHFPPREIRDNGETEHP
jgi:membrane protein implicated in regulation of membrane protease activity